jgi:hypothetical protein
MTPTPIKLLLDEHIWEGLMEALTQRGYAVRHIVNTDQRGIDDETLFALASAQGYAVLTYNVKHFAPLVSQWYETRRDHAGVIFSVQLPPAELLRQVLNLLTRLSAEELQNTGRWLQEFKGE